MSKKIVVGLLLAAVVFLPSCDFGENEDLRAELAKLKRRIGIVTRQKVRLAEKLAVVEEQLKLAEEKIYELKAKAKEDAGKAEIEKQEAVEKAVAEAEELIKAKRLERIRKKAEEREKAREQAREKRMSKTRSRRTRETGAGELEN